MHKLYAHGNTFAIMFRQLITLSGFREPRPVMEKRELSGSYYAVCPRCAVTIDREYVSFCDRCGQRLSWEYYDRETTKDQ